jgi:hypothetical protein
MKILYDSLTNCLRNLAENKSNSVKGNLPYVGVKIIQGTTQTQDVNDMAIAMSFANIKPCMMIYNGTDNILFVCRFAWIWQ